MCMVICFVLSSSHRVIEKRRTTFQINNGTSTDFRRLRRDSLSRKQLFVSWMIEAKQNLISFEAIQGRFGSCINETFSDLRRRKKTNCDDNHESVRKQWLLNRFRNWQSIHNRFLITNWKTSGEKLNFLKFFSFIRGRIVTRWYFEAIQFATWCATKALGEDSKLSFNMMYTCVSLQIDFFHNLVLIFCRFEAFDSAVLDTCRERKVFLLFHRNLPADSD